MFKASSGCPCLSCLWRNRIYGYYMGDAFHHELTRRRISPNICSSISRNGSVHVAYKELLLACPDLPLTILYAKLLGLATLKTPIIETRVCLISSS